MVCDAVPRVVPWNAAKADGVREKRLARAKYLSAVHKTGSTPFGFTEHLKQQRRNDRRSS